MPSSSLKRHMPLAPLALAIAVATHAGSTSADGQSGKVIAPLKEGVPSVFVVHKGRSIKVERDLFQSYQLTSGMRSTLMITDSKCPPFCMQPMQLDVPVDTWSEIEIVDFMLTTLRDNKGLLIDVRGQKEYDEATIPGSEHHFIQKFNDVDQVEKMMAGFGAERRGEVGAVTRLLEDWGISDDPDLTPAWDFTRAKELVVWSNGPTCKLAADAIRTLVAAGYPPHKLHWYRGGMPGWQFWGFNTVRKPKKY